MDIISLYFYTLTLMSILRRFHTSKNVTKYVTSIRIITIDSGL